MLATIVASLLLLQLAFSASPAFASAAGAICSSRTALGGQAQPGAPQEGHHYGQCCLLHCGTADATPPKAQSSLVPHPEAPAPIAAPAQISSLAPRLEPKGAPQSPRAPPTLPGLS